MALQQSQKFTPEEINSVKTLQANVQNVTLKFGQLCVQKLNLEAHFIPSNTPSP